MTRVGQYDEFRTGWPTLATATVGSAFGVTALLFYSLGSLTGPLSQEFGWSRSEISAAFLFTTLALTLSAVPLGWALDRVGPRLVALISVPGLAISLVLLSLFTSGSLVVFYVLFTLAGFFGMGTTSIVYTKAVNASFFKKRGLALGITLTGLGVAALILPPLVTAVVTAAGWRMAFAVLALMALAALPFIYWALPRRNRSTGSDSVLSAGMTRNDALRTRSFWTILAGFVLVGMSVPALIPHMVPALTDAGLTPAKAAGIASLIGVGVIVGRLTIGFLVDRFFAPFVAAPFFLMTAVGCILLLVGGPGLAPLAALMIGVSFGAEADLIAYMCGYYFGLREYGSIYGLIYAIFTIAVSLGPIAAGRVYDQTGTYDVALIGVAAMLVIGSAVLLTLPRTQGSEHGQGLEPARQATEEPSQTVSPASL